MISYRLLYDSKTFEPTGVQVLENGKVVEVSEFCFRNGKVVPKSTVPTFEHMELIMLNNMNDDFLKVNGGYVECEKILCDD